MDGARGAQERVEVLSGGFLPLLSHVLSTFDVHPATLVAVSPCRYLGCDAITQAE